MATAGQRKCACCGEFFLPDHRNRQRQRYCRASPCRRASKAASQAAWLAQPANQGYFCGPLHVQRVREWRAAHPGYDRRSARPEKTARSADFSAPTSTCAVQRSCNAAAGAAPALQDPCAPWTPLLAGLIAHVFQLTLQDDMDLTARRLVELGHDVLNRGARSGQELEAGVAA